MRPPELVGPTEGEVRDPGDPAISTVTVGTAVSLGLNLSVSLLAGPVGASIVGYLAFRAVVLGGTILSDGHDPDRSPEKLDSEQVRDVSSEVIVNRVKLANQPLSFGL